MIGHCAAAMLFDFTGITEGKKLAVHPLAKPAISKGQATDEDSVVDGNFFTAKEEHYICTMMPQVFGGLEEISSKYLSFISQSILSSSAK